MNSSFGNQLYRKYLLDIRVIAIAAIALFILALGAEGIGFRLGVIRPFLSYLLLTIIPGLMVLGLFDIQKISPLRTVVYAVGISIVFSMLLGALANIVLPLVGITAPLSLPPLFLGYTVALFGLVFLLHRAGTSVQIPVPNDLSRKGLLNPGFLAFALLPPLTVLSVTAIEHFDSNPPIIAVLVAIALAPVIVGLGIIKEKYHAFGIWSIGLALLYHRSLSPLNFYRGHSNVATSWLQGRWTPNAGPNASLLPTNVLHPMYAEFAGLNILTHLEVVKPLIVVFLPVAVFGIFKQFVSSRRAFVATAVFMFAHPFYFQFVIYSRADAPTLFLALLVLAATDTEIDRIPRRAFLLLFALGIIVSHYGASYYVLFALAGALGIVMFYKLIDEYLPQLYNRIQIPLSSKVEPRNVEQNPAILTGSFLGFYAVLTIAWFLYTGDGGKFAAIITQVSSSLAEFLNSPLFGGGQTTRKLTTDYNAISITLSKHLYLAIAGLMGIGLLVTHLRQVLSPQQSNIDDEYLALATALLFGYGLSFLGGGWWGGGRPLIMTFAVSALFAMYGIAAILGDSPLHHLGDTIGSGLSPNIHGETVLGVVLAAFLLLNTGVIAATITGGYAPSNVPTQTEFAESEIPRLNSKVYYQQGFEAFGFINNHKIGFLPVFVDFYSSSRYSVPILVEHGIPKHSTNATSFTNLRGANIEPGYVMLEGHVIDQDRYSISSTRTEPISPLREELTARHRIYANRNSIIYYSYRPNVS